VFKLAVDYTIGCLDRGKRTLVHCQAGVSRSDSVCIAADAATRDTDFDSAQAKVEEARSMIDPTPEIWKSTN
jgi:Dual specificity phosphatase, catalytic domain.